MNERKFLSGNQLKFIAAFAMVLDHIVVYLLPQFTVLRIVGRIAFPIFAYMIGEGCVHTKNRKKYLLTVVVCAAVFQLVYYFIAGSLYQCIFVTFTMSIALCFIIDWAMKKNDAKRWCLVVVGIASVYIITVILPYMFKYSDFSVDYGFFGVMLPVAVFIGRNKRDKLLLAIMVMIMLGLEFGHLQWYSFAAVPLLALYNGSRGRMHMKYFFYAFYPLHLAVIYAIGMFV